MSPELSAFRDLAIDVVTGANVAAERRRTVLLAAGKTEQQLADTVKRLLARRNIWEGLTELLGQHQEMQRNLATIAAHPAVTDDERLTDERVKLAAAGMEPAYDEGRACLYDSADLELRDVATFAAGRLDAIRSLRQASVAENREALADELAAIEQRLAAEHEAKLSRLYEWQNVEPL